MRKIKDKERILKAARGKQQIIYKGTPIRLSADFSAEDLQARREWHDIFTMKKGKISRNKNTLLSNPLIQISWRNKNFTDKQKLKVSSTTKPALHQIRKLSRQKRKGHNQKWENYRLKNLTSLGKHTIKVGNHPHTKLVGRLKDKSGKIICIQNKQLRDTQNN